MPGSGSVPVAYRAEGCQHNWQPSSPFAALSVGGRRAPSCPLAESDVFSFRMPLRISHPGGLQLDQPPVCVMDVREVQAELVPKAPKTFEAGPGDRLLQLPLADGTNAGH